MPGNAALLIAAIGFTVFFTNVALGAARAGVFLGDVAEMLALFVSALFFVVGVLQREAAKRKDKG